MHKARRIRPTQAAVAVAAGVAALLGLLVAPSAIAGPQTKWYIATVGKAASPATSTVVYQPSALPQTVYLQIANDLSSNQSFGSADIDLHYDWHWSSFVITTSNGVESGWSISTFDATNHVIHLRNNGIGSQYAILPGQSLTVQIAFTNAAGGIDAPGLTVKQSNDFSDSSTRNTSNVFGTRTASPAIYVGAGPPTQLVYRQGPSDVQMTSTANGTHYMCPPVTAVVEDQDGNLVSWLPTTSVTLSSVGAGLKLDGSSTLSASTSGGIATFGTGNTTDGCTGLTAANQGSYTLTATTTVAAGAGYTGGTFSTPAVGYNVYLQLCGTSCNVDLPGGTQTNANLNASNGTGGNTPLFGSVTPSTLASGCDTSISYRPDQTNVLLDNHDKTITLAWSKKVTNQDPRNGTPFWPVCIQGDLDYQVYVYVTGDSGAATLGSAKNGAMLALCSSPGVTLRQPPLNPGPDHACISSLYKNAASEHAVIWVPDQPGDPHMW